MQRLATLLAVGVVAVAALSQSTLVVPNGCATSEGFTGSPFPWGRGGLGMRHQTIYDSSHFTNQGVTYPIGITALRWRPDANVGLVPSSYPAGCSVFLSTCPVDQSAVVGAFANNRGADHTQVFSGVVSWGAQPAQSGPTPFGIGIQLTTPFVYDPNSGDLNIECDLPIQLFTGTAPMLDVEDGPTTALASRVHMANGFPTGPVFVTNNHAVVVEVTYAATGYAYSSNYGAGCIHRLDASTYENFPIATFDLANTAISMLRTNGGYVAVPGLVGFVAPSGSAATLGLADDSELTVPLSAAMPIDAGRSTSSLVVCSNGFVSAGPGNGVQFAPIAARFLDSASLWWSACWHDFDPSHPFGGRVKFEEVSGIACVTWHGVWDYAGTSAANANTFQIQFDLATGSVHYVFQTMSLLGNARLVGVSDAGFSVDPGSMDISTALPATYQAAAFAVSPLGLAASARPVIGNVISLESSNIPGMGVIGLTILGMTEYTAGIDLGFLGMPTCRLHASLDVTAGFMPAQGVGSTPFAIPAVPSLAGTIVRGQSAVLVPGINPFGFLTSNGLRLVLDVL
ncbi:MAG TPA: hypothetical protein VF384_07160 [Planctomycetota bacterium]